MDLRRATINGKSWDEVQDEVRRYGEENSLEVEPPGYLPLKDADFVSLKLYKPSALVPVAEFRPFFQTDGKTFKNISIEYYVDESIGQLLEKLKITSQAS